MADTSMEEILRKAGDGKEIGEEEMVICPCCGKATLKKPIAPSGEIMDHFLACMMTGEPYVRPYSLYGGKMTIAVSQVTTTLAKKVESACTILSGWDAKFPDRSTQINLISGAIKTYACIESVRVDAGSVKVFTPGSRVLDMCGEIIELARPVSTGDVDDATLGAALDKFEKLVTDNQLMSAVPSSVLLSLAQLHSQVYGMLLDAGFDKNFWGRIKLA